VVTDDANARTVLARSVRMGPPAKQGSVNMSLRWHCRASRARIGPAAARTPSPSRHTTTVRA